MKKILLVMLILCFSFNLIFAKTHKQESASKNKDIQHSEIKNTQQTSKRFFDDREKGWFWYEKQKLEEEEKTKIDNKTILATPIIKKPEIPWERLYNMPPKEFNKLIEEVRDYAISYPTVENVKNYMKMQNIALERSQKFQNVFTFIAQTDPTLTNEKSYPIAAVGQEEYHYKKKFVRYEYVKNKSHKYGIIYFYSNSCQFCKSQLPIIKKLIEENNFEYNSVDYDSNFTLRQFFGIISVPSVVLVKKDTKDWLLISSGLIDFQELNERLYRSIKYLEGERDLENYSNPDYFIGK